MTEEVESTGTHAIVQEEEQEINAKADNEGVEDGADAEGDAPDEGINDARSDIFKLIDDEARPMKEAAHADIEVEKDGPEKGEDCAANQAGDAVAAQGPGEEAGDKNTKTEGRKEIHDEANGESARDFLTFTADAKQAERVEKNPTIN